MEFRKRNRKKVLFSKIIGNKVWLFSTITIYLLVYKSTDYIFNKKFNLLMILALIIIAFIK